MDASSPRTSYMRAAESDSTVLCDRGKMAAFYISDTSALAARTPPLPPRPTTAEPGSLRVAHYNLNVLHGHDFKSPVEAGDAAKALLALDADVLLLQEAGVQSFSPEYEVEPHFRDLDSSARIDELHALLKAAGYALLSTAGVSDNDNPAMIATRLPILSPGEAFCLDDAHEWTATMRSTELLRSKGIPPVPETRAARIVRLALGGEATLDVVVTHLHHTERGMPGLRVAEVRAVQEALASLQPPASAQLWATDFNGQRRQDYTSREWDLVEAGKARIEPGGTAEDGVAALLSASGWLCTYDAPGQQSPAFTHWTSTTVDFCWVRSAAATRAVVHGVYVVPLGLSDHLPVVHDISIGV